MSLLLRAGVLPYRLEIAYRTVAALPKKERVCQQVELLLRLDEKDKEVTNQAIDENLSILRRLNLVDVETDDSEKRYVAVKKVSSKGSPGNFRQLLEQELLEKENALQNEQEGLGLALAWLLEQDPWTPLTKGDNPAAEVKQQLNEEVLELTNNTRFDNLVYWAQFFGLAHRLKTSEKGREKVIPDPTPALRRQLNSVVRSFSASEIDAVPIDTWLARNGKLCPVLEEGWLRAKLVSHLAVDFVREPNELSRSTSLAMSRLANEGHIEILQYADANAKRMVLPTGERTVSHIRIVSRGGGK